MVKLFEQLNLREMGTKKKNLEMQNYPYREMGSGWLVGWVIGQKIGKKIRIGYQIIRKKNRPETVKLLKKKRKYALYGLNVGVCLVGVYILVLVLYLAR